MLYFICSLPDTKRPGRIPSLVTDDAAKLAAFRQAWNIQGRGTYRCVALLKDGARRRSLDDVAALSVVHVDVDFRHVACSPGEVERRQRQLPLPAELRHSGGGFHVVWHLREPVLAGTPEFDQLSKIRTQLTRALAGDPMPDHAAALLREVGTINWKHGEPRECRIVQAAPPVDLTELAELAELADGATWIDPPAKTKANGHSPAANSVDPPSIDVDERLAAMRFKGQGNSGIHLTQLHCTASLVRSGCPVDDVVFAVLEATRKAVAAEPKAASWDWQAEEVEIRRMACDFINKNPELSDLLPDNLKVAWDDRLVHGREPFVVYTKHNGWMVRSREVKTADNPDTAAPKDPIKLPGKGAFVLRPFVPFDLAALPPRRWLYGRHYQRGTVSMTTAPGGFGKTTLDLVEFVAMATGRNLLGEQPEERLRVWYHNGEDTLEELNRRLGAICLHYSIPQEELQGWFFMTTGNEVPLRVANGYRDLKLDKPLIEHIGAEIRRNEVDVAGFDPLVTLHSVAERDTGSMDAVIRVFAGIAETCDCGIELSHHTRKLAPGMTDYTIDDIRGAGSIKDAVRAARMLNQMTEKDGEALGIPEHERTAYFRVDRVKGNNAPAQKAVWRRFVNVDLPNTDEVGVVVPWDYPGQGEPTAERAAAEQKADDVFLRLLAQYTRRESNVSANSGPTYAPTKFVKEREARDAKVSKAALEDAMRRLLDTGRIILDAHGRGGRPAHRLVFGHDPVKG